MPGLPVALPTQTDLVLACLFLGGLQFLVVFRFWLGLRRAAPPAPDPAASPPVAVLVPCAGITPGFSDNLRSILWQDYPGPVEFIFVTPGERDPAYGAVELVLRDSSARARLLASGKVPQRASGKIVDLLHALERVSPETEVLVFVDADLRVPEGWLRSLVGALADPGTGVATASMLYIPVRGRLGSLLRMVWTGSGMPYFDMMGSVTGQSFAMRRSDFEELKVAELWSRSLLEDLALSRRVRSWSKKVRFVHAAVPHGFDDSGFAEGVALFDKWMTCYRVYDKRVWLLGALVTAFKTYVFLWSLMPPCSPLLILLLFGIDAAALAAVFAMLRAYLPDRFEGIHPGYRWVAAAAALCAPLLQFTYLLNYGASIATRDVAWGPYTYRLRGPQDVEVVRPRD